MAAQENMETNASQRESSVRRIKLVKSKMIDTFNLHDLIPHGPRIPMFSAKDVFENDVFARQQGKETFNPVHFKISPQHPPVITERCRRMTRLRNRHSKYPPLNVFAHWILESDVFNRIIVWLIVLNAVQLGLKTGIPTGTRPYAVLHAVLDAVDSCIMVVFLLEILLQWLHHFCHFWKNFWNVFDFTITIMSILPDIIMAFRPEAGNLAVVKLLKNLRILRALKLLCKLERFRLILLSISKTFVTMVPIIGLLLMLFCIFALAGVALFEKFSSSQMEDLVFKNAFIDIPSALTTLFMIFTLDHWYALLTEMISEPELSRPLCYIYLILWIVVVSFTFQRIVMGLMATQFHMIQSNINEELEQHKLRAKQRTEDAILHRPSEGEQAEGTEDPDPSVEERDRQAGEQENMENMEHGVQENMAALLNQAQSTQLFRYFELLELIQDNLDKREMLAARLSEQLAVQESPSLH